MGGKQQMKLNFRVRRSLAGHCAIKSRNRGLEYTEKSISRLHIADIWQVTPRRLHQKLEHIYLAAASVQFVSTQLGPRATD